MGSSTPDTKLRSRRHNLVLLVVAAVVVAVDQLTKWWALATLDDRDIDLVWTLRLHLVYNRGAAFGLGQDLDTVIAVVALLFVIVVAWASWGGRRFVAVTGAVGHDSGRRGRQSGRSGAAIRRRISGRGRGRLHRPPVVAGVQPRPTLPSWWLALSWC